MGKADMKTVLCFVPDQCADFEAVLALHLLNGNGGRQLKTVGFSHEPVTAQSGLRYTADLTLEEAAELSDVEAVVLPGGPLREQDERLSAFLLLMNRRGVLLAAICFAPQYLARCGLLDARGYTTSCTPEHARSAGMADPFPRGTYRDERVVIDGNIITAKGHAFVDFAFEVAKALGDTFGHEDEYGGLYRSISNVK